MIPKVIHYCWFGKKQKPSSVLKMMESWKKYAPDYEIKEWNEENFDVNINDYCREAYQKQKWAFVSDVARIHALYNEGGIYLDTDVEILRSFNKLLLSDGFLGFEGTQFISTAVIGSAKNNELFRLFIDSYNSRKFIKENGEIDTTTNVSVMTSLLKEKYGLKVNGSRQQAGPFEVYPTDYFTPYDYLNGKLNKTKNTYSIHWFDQSWIMGRKKYNNLIYHLYHRLRGVKME